MLLQVIRADDMRKAHFTDVQRAIDGGWHIVVESTIPLFGHPIIRWVCGIPAMVSQEFIHLEVKGLTTFGRHPRSVAWGWVKQVHILTRPQPSAKQLQALGIRTCHGSVLRAPALWHNRHKPVRALYHGR